ncbi:hypothetical protein LCGC14_0378370 [marine sediment metagenome]|uniref:Uncharacterized protein n=1 Tax=marine sediment metagenome TaxID=412755 RepID=A0A0F9T8N9_9ZZZZ
MALIRLSDERGVPGDFVTELSPFPTRDVPLRRIPLSGGQLGLVVSTNVVALTVPDAATSAEMYVRTASVTFIRTSGLIPSATAGFQADATDIIVLRSRDECLEFKAIRVSADATLDAEYFGEAA